MSAELPNGGPLLAICVPTFNRAQNLRSLFRSLGAVKVRFGDEVEICISNNGSSDDTRGIIEEFARCHAIVESHQVSNIGATLNIIAVAAQMNAKWGIWCGDDDEVDPNAIGSILSLLRSLPKETWVLVDSAGLDGIGQYMRDFTEGEYTTANFRWAVLRRGLAPFGFMGVHIFPRSAVTVLQTLGADARPWPPIICMLIFVARQSAKVHILHATPILQAKGGALLFWNAGDWARVCLSKLLILAKADAATSGLYLFHRALMLRELYNIPNLGVLIAWKLYEPADFNAHALRTCWDVWYQTGALIPLVLPHILFMIIIRILPHSFLALLFKLACCGHFIGRYAQRKLQSQTKDGVKRGM